MDFEAFNDNPSLLFSSELVAKIGRKIFPWAVAGPFLFSFILYGKPLNANALSRLNASSRRMSSARLEMVDIVKSAEIEAETKEENAEAEGDVEKKDEEGEVDGVLDDAKVAELGHEKVAQMDFKTEHPDPERVQKAEKKTSSWFQYKSWIWADDEAVEEEREEEVELKEPKSLRPTSEQLKQLHLKKGLNKVVFSVRTGLRGKVRGSLLGLTQDRRPDSALQSVSVGAVGAHRGVRCRWHHHQVRRARHVPALCGQRLVASGSHAALHSAL